ncbi:hypothetical protein [Salinibacterium sp. M195]|uniref:hypothetical protein n=1 Tax=Salinibacterium sp. M195 TaxID=2583374 RepID=UPI001C62E9B1|nr:hypothetical protein [Salinibacterium sp. M195]QYH34741.1 hypothetical protein FFT87_01590 [Salinibacterium sp. M195]
MTHTSGSTTAAPAHTSLKKILRGDTPVLLVHKSVQAAQRLDEVFGQLAVLHGKNLGVGTVIRLPGMSSAAASRYMSSHSSIPLRFVDPELHLNPAGDWPDAPAMSASAMAWPYLTGLPTKPTAAWIKQVLEVQSDHGATVHLSASGWVSEVNGRKSLDAAMLFVKESRQSLGNEPMFVNLTLDSRWLSDSALRELLLQEMVESNEKRWYLRFYWPEVSPRYGQLVDEALLRGYKELSAVAAAEGKQLYLPNSGLTGWIATALGATGFSTGQSWPEQAFARQRRAGGRAGQPPPPRIPRLFDSTLLHTVEFAESVRLRGFTGHKHYDSAFSLEIDAAGHDSKTASLHYLMAVGRMQARLNIARPNIGALKRARKGSAFLKSLNRVDRPAGLNRAEQLPVWESILR